MLKKKNNTTSPQDLDTIIGVNSSFDGSFKTSGLLRVDGFFSGDITVEGNVIVGKEGKIVGSITAKNIELSGIIEGNVISSEQMKISSSGKLVGDIEVGSFVVEENGVFDGKCRMKNSNTTIMEESKLSRDIKAI